MHIGECARHPTLQSWLRFSKTLFSSPPQPSALRRQALPLRLSTGPPGPSSRMVPKLAAESTSENHSTTPVLAELQFGDARRGGHLHPDFARGSADLRFDVVRIIDMNNLEAKNTTRKSSPEPGQHPLFTRARTAPAPAKVVQEPERAAAARPTLARGRRECPPSCLQAGQCWASRGRAAERVSQNRSCLKIEARTVRCEKRKL